MSSDQPGHSDSFEFAAFILWYLFLIVCCVLPTCCAYRRRIIMSRARQQQASERHNNNNNHDIFILGNWGRPDEEEVRIEHTKRITEALKVTSFVVAETDITANADEKKSSDLVDEELGAVYDHEVMDHALLQLPVEKPNGKRTVPGGCAICLEVYKPGDRVAWSKETSCKHAFHSDCIVPWLAKKEEPNCPCCRQKFCAVQPLTMSDFTSSRPFGLIPATMLMGQNSLQRRDDESLPTSEVRNASEVIETDNRILEATQEEETPPLNEVNDIEENFSEGPESDAVTTSPPPTAEGSSSPQVAEGSSSIVNNESHS